MRASWARCGPDDRRPPAIPRALPGPDEPRPGFSPAAGDAAGRPRPYGRRAMTSDHQRATDKEGPMPSEPEPDYGQSTAWRPERPRWRVFPLVVSWLATAVALMVA